MPAAMDPAFPKAATNPPGPPDGGPIDGAAPPSPGGPPIPNGPNAPETAPPDLFCPPPKTAVATSASEPFDLDAADAPPPEPPPAAEAAPSCPPMPGRFPPIEAASDWPTLPIMLCGFATAIAVPATAESMPPNTVPTTDVPFRIPLQIFGDKNKNAIDPK